MKCQIKFTALAAMLVAFGSTVSFAQSSGGQCMAERFQMLDSDGDGRLSAAEAAELRDAVFLAMNADGDA